MEALGWSFFGLTLIVLNVTFFFYLRSGKKGDSSPQE